MTWTLGLALGAISGGAVLEAGILALLLLVPTLVWAVRERLRPLGLGGCIVGFGSGAGGLLLLADARCAAENVSGAGFSSQCVMPDLTLYFAGAALLIAIGAVVTLAAVRRSSQAS